MEWLLVFAVVAIVLLPPRYDPAIRLSEWVAKRRSKT